MTAKFVMLVLATVSLAACATATTDDLSVRRNASPTKGEISARRPMIRGPVVPDTVAPHRTTLAHRAPAVHRATATRPAIASRPATTQRAITQPAPSQYAAREVPNPLRDAPTAPAPTQDTVPTFGLPTEPVQPASVSDQPVQASPDVAPVTSADVPIQETQQTGSPFPDVPGLLGLNGVTTDTVEQMFGGMPFWLISLIAAALVATFGLALRSKPEEDDEDYERPDRVDPEEDYREPYAA